MDENRTLTRPEGVGSQTEDCDLDQIVERLGWTPLERVKYLLDMLEFEERAHRAKRLEC